MHSRGDWIKYLFQDDLLNPGALERLVRIPESALIACSRVDYIIESGVSEETRNYFENDLKHIADIYGEQDFMSPEEISLAAIDHFPKNIIGEPIAIFFSRRAMPLYGFFNANLIMSCDYEYFLRLAINEGIFSINEPLVSFSVHANSTSADNLKRKRFRMEVLDNLIILHEIVFSPYYAKFRAELRKKRANIDLFNFFAYSVRRTLKQIDLNPEDGESFRRVAAKYPMMNVCKGRFKIFSTYMEKFLTTN